MRYLIVFFVLPFILVGCPLSEPRDPADEKVTPVEDVNDCSSGCQNLRKLKCTDILEELNDETGTCEEACSHVIESGSNLGVENWKNFKSCDEFNH